MLYSEAQTYFPMMFQITATVLYTRTGKPAQSSAVYEYIHIMSSLHAEEIPKVRSRTTTEY